MIRFDYSGQLPYLAVVGDSNEVLLAKDILGDIPGITCSRRYVRFPAKTRLLELLLEKLPPGEEVDLPVAKWYSKCMKEELARAELGMLEDVAINHPNASRLWAFQRVGASFMSKLGKSILADSCGLGKTATSIVGVETARHHNKILVICPNSLKQWWASEITSWSSNRKPIIIVESRNREPALRRYKQGWLIINYEQTYRAPQLAHTFFDWIICDEAQRLKNRKTRTWKAVQKLKYRRAVLLTGTPYGNNPAELWALLHLLEPQKFRSYWRFFEMYVNYHEDYFGSREILGVKNPELLRRELSSIMLRRTKEEVLAELPPKRYQTVPLKMTEGQEKIYRKAASEYLIELEDKEDIEIANVISMITRLRQILSSPAAFDLFEPSCKIKAAMDLIESMNDKLVVLSQFRATIEELHRLLSEKCIGHVYVMGGMDVSQAVDTFQNDPECKVFLGTAATGGVGLTLTAASTLLFLEKHWNPAQQQQAEDRIHRLTQKKSVHIISLTCPGTVDDLVERALNRKLQMIGAVLGKALIDSLREWA